MYASILFFMDQVWHQQAKDKAAEVDRADWRVFEAANDILDLRLFEVGIREDQKKRHPAVYKLTRQQ